MARLRKQRDLLKQQQKQKRDQELEDFNNKLAENTVEKKPDLFNEFK